MSERDPELERLFRAARREEGPTDDDRRAVRSSIAGRLAVAAAAGSAVTLVPRAVAAAASAGVGKATILGWFAAGLGAGAAVGAVVTATVVLREKNEHPVAPSAVLTASAPVPHVVSPPRAPVAAVPDATATATTSNEKPVRSVPEAAGSPPPLEAETRALGEVTRALRDGRAGEALRLLAEQEKTFARGSLHEERAAARVFALCGAGRLAAGRSARERFLIDYPQSPSADRVRASCLP